jgi:hypothetical protein
LEEEEVVAEEPTTNVLIVAVKIISSETVNVIRPVGYVAEQVIFPLFFSKLCSTFSPYF